MLNREDAKTLDKYLLETGHARTIGGEFMLILEEAPWGFPRRLRDLIGTADCASTPTLDCGLYE